MRVLLFILLAIVAVNLVVGQRKISKAKRCRLLKELIASTEAIAATGQGNPDFKARLADRLNKSKAAYQKTCETATPPNPAEPETGSSE